VAEWPAQWYSWNGRLRLMFYFLIFVGFLVGVAQGTYDINLKLSLWLHAQLFRLPGASYAKEGIAVLVVSGDRAMAAVARQVLWRRFQIRKAVSP